MGRTHKEERQRFLVGLTTVSYERRRPHASFRKHDAFDRNFLVTGLNCRGSATTYKKLLRPFYEFPEENRHYSKKCGLTKPYRLRPEVLAALDDVYQGDAPLPIVDADTGERVAELPKSGLPSELQEAATVPGVILLDTARIDMALTRVQDWIEKCGRDCPLDIHKPSGATLHEALRLLRVARKWTISTGGLPNVYCLQSHGRLGPLGFHVIGLPRLVRRLLFEGSGLSDFDIASCFPSIFASLGRSYGFPVVHVERYISLKHRYHEYWAHTTHNPSNQDVFKPLIASFFTGGTLSASPKTASGKALGPVAMEHFKNDEVAQLFFREITSGMKRIVQESSKERDGRDTVFTNAVGARLIVSGERSDFGRICAHLLTGYEQFAIRTVCNQVEGLQGIIYDGFLAAPQPTCGLESRIRTESVERLGVMLDLKLKQEDFSEPTPDIELDDLDF